jgi:hypothetical protein
MRGERVIAAVLTLVVMSGPGFARAVGAQSVAGSLPPPPGAPRPVPSGDDTPPRVSYLDGEVSFWRQGASDWARAQLNTPLALGDVLYTGPGGTVEIQVERAAFVRAGNDTQIGLDNQEPDFLQFRVTAGHAGIDLRQLPPGSTVEVDTPQAAFTIVHAGYYRLDVDQESTTFATHRGGTATVTPPSGVPAPIAANQQVVLTGAGMPAVALEAAPPLNAWDNWNYQRSAYLLQPASQRYVSLAMYGAEELDQHGTWRTVETYGPVWVPSGVPAGWQPYSTGRWIWDPRFGWTWLDDAPWGWAPYHYGRWVFFGSYWGWAPGPVVVRVAYAPALVVFLGGASVGVAARPVGWAPLGWGEPVVPWWGRAGFIGVPWWGGWGGPRVVNNVVINRTTIVNVSNITVYRNVNVTHAVVGVPADHFGRGQARIVRISQTEVQHLRPVHGALDVRPVAASLVPGAGPGINPPAALRDRPVVATHAPKDLTPMLREHGLIESREMHAPARLVPSPGREPRPEGAGVPSPPGTGKAPSARPGTAGPVPRGPEGSAGGARPAPPPSRGVKGPPAKVAPPSEALPGAKQPPRASERPLPKAPPQAQAPANRPGAPPRAEHPRHVEQSNRPAHGEKPDKEKER